MVNKSAPDAMSTKEDFVFEALTSAVKDYESGIRDVPLPYFLIYNGILMDEDDATYTHIDSDFKDNNNNAVEKLIVNGITQYNKFVKLSSNA